MRNRGMRGRMYVGLAFALVLVGLVFAPAGSAGGNATCTGVWAGGNVNGDLVAGPGCTLGAITVSHDLTVAPNGSLSTSGTTVGHDLTIEHTSSNSYLCGTTVGHDIVVAHNTGSISFDDYCGSSRVGHDLDISGNSGGVSVAGTSIGHDLTCQGDNPAASLDTASTVGHQIIGTECATAKSTKCPAAGCELTVSAGDFSADVTASGGSAGTLSVTLYPNAPESDGCGHGDADVVGVSPPNGASVTLDITLPGYAPGDVCKSSDGSPYSFEPIPRCSTTEGGTPCWEYTGDTEAQNEVLVHLGPGDPWVTKN